ncbi:MAG: efflux transporter outer membrane subunit, partial [Pseudomonadota bacterium]|nr:efflux transporter outer membrane subunit [Pseudomonadota bacterium]
MLKQQTRTITRLLPLAVATALAACAAKPLERAPPVELPDSFSHHRNTTGDPVADRWWQAFDDAALTQLVNRALDDNLSLKASYQRLLQARAVADRQSASLFPSVDTSADAQRQESDTTGSTRYSAGLNASYEVDLWGRVRAQVEAEELRASASLADYQAAAISLSGEIASTWFRLVEQRAQSELARDQLKTNQDVLRLIETRFATGLSGSADVLRQRQLVSSSRERLYNIEAERRTLEHQLAVLLGQSPGRAELPASKSLPELPPLPDTGIPAELVQQRPDIRQAWQLVAASDKDLAAAISDRFPRFSIEASVTSQSADAGDLFDNWLATLAGNLVMPLIDGGQRQAEVR